MKPSHSLKFARALIVASGLTGLGFSGCGRGGPVEPGTDAGSDAGAVLADAGTVDAGQADAGVDAGFTCASCSCAPPLDGGQAECSAVGHFECCAAVGPLNPPNLPA